MKDNSEMTKEELIALGWIKKPSDKMQEKTEKQLTAVEWLIKKIDQNFGYVSDTIIEQAKEMEKEQSNDKIQKAIELFEEVKIQADTDKDVTYLDNVLAVLYGIKNTN